MLVSTPKRKNNDNRVIHIGNMWFPPIKIDAVRNSIRITNSVTDERLIESVQYAIISVTKELEKWCQSQEKKGISSLEEIEDNGVSIYLYTLAVHKTVNVFIYEQHQDVTATGEESSRFESKIEQADIFRRDAIHAIRMLKNENCTAVELI